MHEQNDHFVRGLLYLADGSADLDRLTIYLQRLGVGHRRYRVQPEHYPIVGVSLIAALKFLSGPVWTPRLAQAWLNVYTAAADIMVAAQQDHE